MIMVHYTLRKFRQYNKGILSELVWLEITASIKLFTWWMGIGIGCEQVCQDLHGQKGEVARLTLLYCQNFMRVYEKHYVGVQNNTGTVQKNSVLSNLNNCMSLATPCLVFPDKFTSWWSYVHEQHHCSFIRWPADCPWIGGPTCWYL